LVSYSISASNCFVCCRICGSLSFVFNDIDEIEVEIDGSICVFSVSSSIWHDCFTSSGMTILMDKISIKRTTNCWYNCLLTLSCKIGVEALNVKLYIIYKIQYNKILIYNLYHNIRRYISNIYAIIYYRFLFVVYF
jgi:hypothetical protein